MPVHVKVWAAVAACVLTAGFATPALAQSSFPFGKELLLDSAPMRGSKRLPGLDIADDGAVEIALWCATITGQLVVAQDTITVIAGEKPAVNCPPDRARADDVLVSTLAEATHWRMEGETLLIQGNSGPPLRFRLQTN